MDCDRDFDNWEPPSEATMKLLQARRERSDKISKLMGDYLLKGYKMLGITCPDCDTILLKTKHGVNYCVACSELDSDADKDDPVTNQAAALAQAREREVRVSPERPAASPLSSVRAGLAPDHQGRESLLEVSSSNTISERPVMIHHQELNTSANAFVSPARPQGTAGSAESQRYVQHLLEKMDWASGELRAAHSVEYSIQLCQLIKSCAEAVSSVRAALDS